MKFRILAEGSTRWQRLIKHWGLSILIDEDILFDTFGKADYVLRQLGRSGDDIGKIKHVILSHDDWDHVGGLWRILERNHDMTVYICPHFSPAVKEKIRSHGARLIEVKGITNIRDNIYSSGELTGRRGESDIPEQYLAIKTDKGVVLLTGCAHPGIVEIVQHAEANFELDVSLLIGGFHLKDHMENDAHNIILKLKSLGVGRVVPFHCTGAVAQRLFKKEFKEDCIIPGEGRLIRI